MAFLTHRFIKSALKSPAAIRKTQLWDTPDLITLPVQDGVTPCGLPPVRIYLGTEPAQYKAERIFIWSIEQVRDPARVYEIHLMKNLKGFKSRFWLTGFTNYRFAIPHFAQGRGRAIYNDVDQVYLKDPAELFDLPMGEHGYLSVAAGDISVALLDCEKMAHIWSLKDAQTGAKNKLLARAKNAAGLWGQMDGGWNARDREYVAGQSGVLHYTSLHRQPWHPFPGLFVYQNNPQADVWDRLEDGANAAAFRVFSAAQPSQGFGVLRERISGLQKITQTRAPRKTARISRETGELTQLLQESKTKSLLHCRIKACATPTIIPISDSLCSIQHIDPLAALEVPLSSDHFDAVVCEDVLECVPEDDIPWLLEHLFSYAVRLLYCRVHASPRAGQNNEVHRPQPWTRSREWWHYQFETVARHHPNVRWRLHLETRSISAATRPVIIEGNESYQREVRVWSLNGSKLGHTSQANALADMLGWPYEKKQIRQTFFSQIQVLLHLGTGWLETGVCKPPWPDVVIACGWWPSYVARWIRARSGGCTRLLLAGRKSGGLKNTTDIVVCCKHFHLPAHRRRLETLLPVHPLTHDGLAAARQRGERLFEAAAGPRVALLVGGNSQQHSFAAEDALTLAQKVLAQVQQVGGSLFAVTSRRTGSAAAAALTKALQGQATVHVWSAQGHNNPYLEYLASADILVVTGESESMLTDAIATNKPVYIYPLKKRRLSAMMALGQWLLKQSSQHPKNRRGTERPQQGFEYFCARLLQMEWVLPPRDIDSLHRHIVAQGFASMFAESLSTTLERREYAQVDLGARLRVMLEQAERETDDSIVPTYDHEQMLGT